jgi:PKD repeat protein
VCVDVTDLTGYDFKLFWNTVLLDCISATPTPPWSSPLGLVDEVLEEYNSTHGRYWCAQAALTGSFSGTSTLASLTFEAKTNGESPLDLTDVALSAWGSPIGSWDYVDSSEDGYVIVSDTNLPPVPPQPTNLSPEDGAVDVSLRPQLLSSPPLSDVSEEQIPWEEMDGLWVTRVDSQWQITTIQGDYSNPVYSHTLTDGLVDRRFFPELPDAWSGGYVPAGILDYGTMYYWRVRHRDFRGVWSPWSGETSCITRQPYSPVADAGSDKSSSSGDIVLLDGSNSYHPEPDRSIVSYRWSFGDGETAESSLPFVEHRFRGTQNEPKTYTVALTVEDNCGSIATDTAFVTVTPMRKLVDVGPGYFGVSCWMEVTYNWVGSDEATGEDLHIISKIQTYSGGLLGAYQLFILRRIDPPPSIPRLVWYVPLPTAPTLRTYVAPFTPSVWQELWGEPAEITTLTFQEGTFQGIGATDTSLLLIVATGTETGITPYYDAGLTKFEPASPIVRLKPEELKELWELRDIIDLLDKTIGIIGSPCELRIYDSEGHVTGLVNRELKAEIPGSACTNGTILILYPNDTYRYEVAGLDEGTYELLTISVENVNATAFTATETPTSSNAIHQYTIDWTALSLGEPGVNVRVDTDGDGWFDHQFLSDAELNGTEFAQVIAHDVAILDLSTAKRGCSPKETVAEGSMLAINVTVQNQGLSSETFNVVLYSNATVLGTEQFTLSPSTSVTVTFHWNTSGSAKGNYMIRAVSDIMTNETDTADNDVNAGYIVLTLAGDVDGDRDVDIFDIVRMASIYGVAFPDPSYDPNSDIDGDRDIDIFDIVAAAGNYGDSW